MPETGHLKALLDEAQRRLVSALGCDMVASLRLEEDSDLFRVAGQSGCPPELAADFAALTFNRGEPFWGIHSEGSVLVYEDSQPSEGGAMPWLRDRCGMAAMMVAPVFMHGRQLGAIAAIHRTPGRCFSPCQVQAYGGSSRDLAIALEHVETYRTEHEAAEVATALAHLARELLASYDDPGLFVSICKLTAAAIGCASCVTLLWDAERRAFLAVASFGLSDAQSEEIRMLGAQPAASPELLRRLAREEVVEQVDLSPVELLGISAQLRPKAGTVLLFLALRRGGEVIGFEVAAQRPAGRRFSAVQIRIARGAVQLISMALEHARTLQKLECANQLKSEFVATMSHELRTPLHVILGYVDLLRDGAFGALSDQVLDVLVRVRHSSDELLQLVDEVLEMSRLDGGRASVRLQELSPASLLAEIELRCAELPHADAVELRVHCELGLSPIVTDAAKVHAIMRNLVGNALKFTNEGLVSVAATAKDCGLLLSISDTGIGIAPEKQALIFDLFRQGDGTATRRHGGVGLGLYLAHRMVEILGGTITLESELGRGSTFRVWVPDGPRAEIDRCATFQELLAASDGEAAVLGEDGRIVAVNDRWLRFAHDQGARATELLGVGVDYLEVCSRVRGDDAEAARAASIGLHSVLGGALRDFTLEYECIAPCGRWMYRLDASVIEGRTRYALVSHTRLEAAAVDRSHLLPRDVHPR